MSVSCPNCSEGVRTFFKCRACFITHRRSVAKRGGCFQRRLFVCLFVRKIISEQLNIGRSDLAVMYVVQRSRPSSKVKVSGQRSRSPGTKKRKTAKLFPLTMHCRACAVAIDCTQHAATDDTIACHPGVTGYAGGKICACCLVRSSEQM